MAAKTQAEWADYYGWAIALLKSDKSLWSLFQKAIKGTYTAQKFVAELKKTTWYKKYGDTGRKALALKYTDPETWRQRVRTIYQEIMSLAGTMGIKANWQVYWDMAEDAFTFGWSNAQIRKGLASYLTTGKGGAFGGEAGESEAQLEQYAYSMGIKLDRGTTSGWLEGILNGSRTLQDYKGYIQRMAMGAFPGLADQIKGGQSVMDIANPYMQSMARILEVNPETIKLDDPSIRNALAGGVTDKSGKTTPTTQTLWEFENKLRQDPRWLNTNNARQGLNSVAHGVLKDFGLAT
jgi:hypothetical protein